MVAKPAPAPKADNAIDRTICKDPELAKADREMAAAYAALVGKLGGAAKDEAIKAAVLTGSGDKCFAAGGDLRELEAVRDPEDAKAFSIMSPASMRPSFSCTALTWSAGAEEAITGHCLPM